MTNSDRTAHQDFARASRSEALYLQRWHDGLRVVVLVIALGILFTILTVSAALADDHPRVFKAEVIAAVAGQLGDTLTTIHYSGSSVCHESNTAFYGAQPTAAGVLAVKVPLTLSVLAFRVWAEEHDNSKARTFSRMLVWALAVTGVVTTTRNLAVCH